MLIDEVDLIFKAGHGGAGRASFYPGKKSGPDGGNGGVGGNIYIKVTSDLTALNQFSKTKFLKAENGENGGGNKKTGRNGKDLIITLPLGTSLINESTEEEIELNNLDQEILLCKGGLGGRGNFEFRSSTNTTPRNAEAGLEGEEKSFKVVLKLIAEYGLIGLPNAGKSSLLNELTETNVKTAEYPFTTLEPNLGVLQSRIGSKIIADIPGLIAGASSGKGLGINFLKHIEKVKLLLHCISAFSEDVMSDYKTVQTELKNFNPELLEKEEIIVLTKSDLVSKEELLEKIKTLKKFKKEILGVSIYDLDSLQNLRKFLEA